MAEKRTTLFFHGMNIVLLIPLYVVALYDALSLQALVLLVAFFWLGVLLIVPRIMYIPVFKRLHTDLLEIAKQSKWLGLWVFAWFSIYMLLTYAISWQTLFEPKGALALLLWLVLALLALLSNKWSYAHITYWKHINMAVWTLPLPAMAYVWLQLQDKTIAILLTFVLGAAALLGYSVLWRKKDYFSWIRIGYLSVGGLVALVTALFYT